jgi:hypothetical protein
MAFRMTGSFFLMALLTFAGRAAASRLIPRTLPELAAGAEILFIGRCESVSCHWNDDHSLILTANRFRVSRALKGNPGSTFTVEELGGQVGSTILQVSDAPRFTPGEEVLLCVRRTATGRWATFGAGQGKLRIVRDAGGRPWVQSDYYRAELAAMAPVAGTARGVPLPVLAGHLLGIASRSEAR